MEAGSIFLTLALAVLVILFVGRPLARRNGRKPGADSAAADSLEHRRSALLAEHDRLLATLQELDFDQALGKIPAEDYPVQRGALMQRAAGILRELDLMEGQAGAQTAEERIEQAVAARRVDASVAARTAAVPAGVVVPHAVVVQDDLEALIASRRKQRQEKSAGFCPKCGRPVQKSDKFCSACGTVLNEIP
jgi:hypothetical protein